MISMRCTYNIQPTVKNQQQKDDDRTCALYYQCASVGSVSEANAVIVHSPAGDCFVK